MKELTKQEIRRIIEGTTTPTRIPILYDLWIYPEVFHSQKEKLSNLLASVPKDVDSFFVNMPSFAASIPLPPEAEIHKAYDASCLIRNWDNEGALLFENFPVIDPDTLIPPVSLNQSKYILSRWWYCYFERLWSLRGMENALMDFYLFPDEVHILFQKLTDLYMIILETIKCRTNADAVFVSDDIGTQSGPFFSLSIFRDFFKPYYKQLIDKAHSLGMHFWLHSCGNIELFLDDFIEIGLDVIHPIQKKTMDESEIAKKYGDKLCILAGFDVQEIIPFGTPEDVRKEVRRIINTYKNPRGRLMLTMGNGTTPDWKFESIDALYSETLCSMNLGE